MDIGLRLVVQTRPDRPALYAQPTDANKAPMRHVFLGSRLRTPASSHPASRLSSCHRLVVGAINLHRGLAPPSCWSCRAHTLLDRTRSIELLLGEIHSNIEVLLEGPWRTALLHIEDAATHPEKAAYTLELARQFLYQAYGLAPISARRAIIAQELSAVYALLGEHADSLHWLFRAYPDAEGGVGEALADVIASFSDLSPVKAHVKTEAGFPVKAPPGVLVVVRPADDKPMLCVQHEPLATALAALALSCRELAELRLYCATVGMPQHWKDPPWRVEGGEEEEGFHVIELQQPGGPPYMVFGPPLIGWRPSPKQRLFQASITLQELDIWSFRVTGVPVPSSDPPGDAGCGVFVSGPCPELGAWCEELAMPLARGESFWRPCMFRG